MKEQSKKIIGLFARYIAVFLVGLGNLYLFYKTLTPLTIYVTNAILSIFTDTTLSDTLIRLNSVGISIEIVPACVAGSAFYLLLLLIMSTADIKPETRTKATITSFVILFAINILRILVLVPFASSPYFDAIHWIFWHLISVVFVVGVWLLTIKLYKIKSIPVYSDLKYIASLIKTKKTKRKKKHK